MAADPPAKMLLIVTGSTLRAEEVDRPLAYYLKQRIDQWPAGAAAGDEDDGEDSPRAPMRVLVVADFRWMNDEPLQDLPTISIGGPGVNALARLWLQKVPVSLAVEGHYFLQMDPDLDELRASVWGMDNTTTQLAISVFVDRFLPRFLERVATSTSGPIDLDDTP